MIRINLLPREARVKQREFKLPQMGTVYMVGAVVLFLGAMFFTGVTQQHRIKVLEGKIAAANEESKKLAPQLAKIKEITKEREEVDRRLGIIAELDRSRYFRVKLLNDVSFNLPANCWLTEFNEVSPNTFGLNGVAFSNYTVADMMTNLETSPTISRVDLKVAEKGKMNDREVMKFKLIANVMPQ
ncbi:MAG: PilN domain-containing protein [Candidatus Krumholzibacteria bacterium]|nr:PilN domain-containing protein [Candidatus Krumholzibacteria bacterium]